MIFLREQKTDLEPKREVVDGPLRIRTLLTFIQSSLVRNFDATRVAFTINKTHNKDLADKPFEDLPPSVDSCIV